MEILITMLLAIAACFAAVAVIEEDVVVAPATSASVNAGEVACLVDRVSMLIEYSINTECGYAFYKEIVEDICILESYRIALISSYEEYGATIAAMDAVVDKFYTVFH